MKLEKHLPYFLSTMLAFFALVLLLSIGCGSGSSYSSGSSSGSSGGSSGGGGTPPPPANAKEWTWVGGSDTTPYGTGGSPGVYGTQGVASTSNIPGVRVNAAAWTDPSGNFWLLGGHSMDSTGTFAFGNDLWEYVPATGAWTWISGADVLSKQVAGPTGNYGTLGVGSTANVPGGRVAPVTWADSGGNLWLFGGAGVDSTGAEGNLNDLWEFSPAAKTWTWVGGSNVVGGAAGSSDNIGPAGVYGTQGTPSATNSPGGRWKAVTWTDSNGHFWLFGGDGVDSTGLEADLNDLWEFNPADKTWVWISGNNTVNAAGVYGTQNVASSSNFPGARDSAVSWIDSSGNLWLFGGYGKDASGTLGTLNDLWEFSPANNNWTWVSGSNSSGQYGRGQSGVYGTEGTAAAGNFPGGRTNAVSWTDGSGNLWLFGGAGVDSTPATGVPVELNDLWEFNLTSKMWTWVSGDQFGNKSGSYGTLGVASTNVMPGGRNSAVSFRDANGNLWMFGGYGLNSVPGIGAYLNDLWRYAP